MGISHNQGYLFGGPYNKDYSILGSILRYPDFGKLPYFYGFFLDLHVLLNGAREVPNRGHVSFSE